MEIKVFGKNGNSRIFKINTIKELKQISKCFERWVYCGLSGYETSIK